MRAHALRPAAFDACLTALGASAIDEIDDLAGLTREELDGEAPCAALKLAQKRRLLAALREPRHSPSPPPTPPPPPLSPFLFSLVTTQTRGLWYGDAAGRGGFAGFAGSRSARRQASARAANAAAGLWSRVQTAVEAVDAARARLSSSGGAAYGAVASAVAARMETAKRVASKMGAPVEADEDEDEDEEKDELRLRRSRSRARRLAESAKAASAAMRSWDERL